jgi:hypothetical protein
MAKHEVDQQLDPAIHPEFQEPPFLPTTIEAARHSDGLVWWRPNGVISETPEGDSVLVRRG